MDVDVDVDGCVRSGVGCWLLVVGWMVAWWLMIWVDFDFDWIFDSS